MNQSIDTEFESEFFTIQKMADGVFALIERERGKTGSNAGIIELGDDVVVFDTFLSIDAGKDIKKACLSLIGKLPSYIINSHSHTDHVIGNCLFPKDVLVISSNGTRNQMVELKNEFEMEKHQYPARVQELKESLLKGNNKTEIANINNELSFVSNLANPNVAIRVPDITFEKEMILHGDQRNLHLIAHPIGHSVGDVLAYLPDDKICFTGDLLFAESHPWLGSGNPEQSISILEELLEYDIEYFIPGHGRIATKKDVELQIQYIKEIIQLVENKKLIKNATFSVDELSPVFSGWRDLTFQWNIDFLLERK